MSPSTVSPLSKIKAITCDVFGTVVDWRSTLTDELTMRAHRKLATDLSPDLKARLERLGEADWGRFAHEWHQSYGAFTRAYDPEKDTWKTIDEHQLESLTRQLKSWDLEDLYSGAEIKSLSLVWHRLTAYPDSSLGLRTLRTFLRTSTLSNGNVSLLQDLDDFGDLRFHSLLSAETFHAYKPNPATYLGAARELGCEPGQVAMVAAHLEDLQAARGCGLRTIYIARPREEVWKEGDENYRNAREWVDMWVSEEEDGFRTVARKLRDLL